MQKWAKITYMNDGWMDYLPGVLTRANVVVDHMALYLTYGHHKQAQFGQ